MSVSLIELLMTAAIMLVLTGALFPLVNPSHGMAVVQAEHADVHQRIRVAAGALFRDLAMAGAGAYQGGPMGRTGSLNEFFAPMLPYRAGRLNSDPANGVRYRPDAISIVYTPQTTAQTTIQGRIATGAGPVSVDAGPGCPVSDPACGFVRGMTVLVFDGTTAWDSFEIVAVDGSSLSLEHRGQSFSRPYEAGAVIAQAEWHTYYFNEAAGQLRHYDGYQTDVPVVDNVVGLHFAYFGAPDPPRLPRPIPGEENCIIDATGAAKLARLPSDGGALVELDPATLSDGGVGAVQWCGANANLFDPDLLRIRKVRVTLRVQAGLATLRGTDALLFRNPGHARTGDRFVPDAEVVFDVTPRNLAAR